MATTVTPPTQSPQSSLTSFPSPVGISPGNTPITSSSPIVEIRGISSRTTAISQSNSSLLTDTTNLSTRRQSEPKLEDTVHPNYSKLTIYSHSGHIVQKYDQGNKIITLPKSVEIASIVIIDSDGTIIPFSYVPETNMGIALTNRSTGEKVETSVVKDGQTINGKILSLDSDNVMLLTDSHISNIRKYDRVTVGISDDYTRPRLVLEKNNKAFTLSYLLSSIEWNCIGTALIDNTNNVIYLRLAGNIVNNTESDIAANTILVSGEVYQQRQQQNDFAESNQIVPRAMYAMAAPGPPMSSRRVSTGMLEDYTKYDVGNRTIRTKDIAELGTLSFPIIKIYVHKTNDVDKVKFGYRFISPGFIPGCSLNVYSIDNNKSIDAYLGSNMIDESQKGDEVDIMLGESTMLQCKSLIVVSDIVIRDEATAKQYGLPTETFSKTYQHNDNAEWHIITEDLTVDLINHNDVVSSLILKHFVGNKLLVNINCKTYKQRKHGFIEWYFQIPPKTGDEPRKERFSCKILTASYH